jgi:hypothetical protein
MNDRTRRRLEQIEGAVGASRQASEIPEPFDTLSTEDRAILKPYFEARKKHEAATREWPAEVHRAMHRYLKACVEHSRLMREAGVPMMGIAETMRRVRFVNRENAE